MRPWLWLGIALDAILFLPALYFARVAVLSALASAAAGYSVPVAALFAALPILCVVAPVAAWRAWARGRQCHALATLAAPLAYAAYLVVFLRPF